MGKAEAQLLGLRTSSGDTYYAERNRSAARGGSGGFGGSAFQGQSGGTDFDYQAEERRQFNLGPTGTPARRGVGGEGGGSAGGAGGRGGNVNVSVNIDPNATARQIAEKIAPVLRAEGERQNALVAAIVDNDRVRRGL